MATCYRHPSRETGVVLLQLRAPDLPGLHDARRPSACAAPSARSSARRSSDCADVASVPRVTYTLIAINVIAFLTEQGQFRVRETGVTATPSIAEGVLVPAKRSRRQHDQYWRLVTAGSCTRTSSTSASTCTCCTSLGAAARARDRVAALRRDLLHLAARRLVRALLLATTQPDARRVRRDLRV